MQQTIDLELLDRINSFVVFLCSHVLGSYSPIVQNKTKQKNPDISEFMLYDLSCVLTNV